MIQPMQIQIPMNNITLNKTVKLKFFYPNDQDHSLVVKIMDKKGILIFVLSIVEGVLMLAFIIASYCAIKIRRAEKKKQIERQEDDKDISILNTTAMQI